MSHTADVLPAGEIMLPPADAELGSGVYTSKLGMWIFLLSEVMFFTALIGSYIILRFSKPEAWGAPGSVLTSPDGGQHLHPHLQQRDDGEGMPRPPTAGSRPGCGWWPRCHRRHVRGVQVLEYNQLIGHEACPVGLYGSTFYTMTGFHGFHVTMGVLCMIFVTWRAFKGAYTVADHRGVEVIGLYWHFVDLVWIILFTIVYLI
jgi:heme/copper-type cytochrome/quinol oxidase subunit 3